MEALKDLASTYQHNANVAFKEGRLEDGEEHTAVVYGLMLAIGFLVSLTTKGICAITGCVNTTHASDTFCGECQDLMTKNPGKTFTGIA